MFWVWADGVTPHQFRYDDVSQVISALEPNDGDEVAWFFLGFKPMEFRYDPEDLDELARVLARVDENELVRKVIENAGPESGEDGFEARCAIRELRNFVETARSDGKPLFIERQGPCW